MAGKDFQTGSLVWAKMKNFPFWPAKIADPPIVLEKDICTAKGPQRKKSCTPRKAQHYVFFFGSQNYAWISDENIVPHSVEMLSNVSRKKSTSYIKAVDEIIAAEGVKVPNLKLVSKEPVENDESTKNLIDGEFVESTKQKVKVEKTEEPVGYDKSAKEFLDIWHTEKITKTPSVKDDEILKKSTVVDFVKKSITPKQKIKYGNTKKPVENIESANKLAAVWNQKNIRMTRGIKDDKLVKKSPTADFVKKNTIPKQRSKSGKTKEPVQDDKSTKIFTPAWYSKESSVLDEELLLISPAVGFIKSTTLKQKIKVEKTEEPVKDIKSTKNFTDVRNLKKNAKIPSIKDKKLRKTFTMDFVKKSTTPKQKNKREKTKNFVENHESSKGFSAVKSREKTTKIPSVADDKKSTVLPIKKSRTPKEKVTCEKTKRPPLKRKLTEEKLSPMRKLSRKSDDNSASIFNTPLNNTYNTFGLNRPLDDRSMVGQKYAEPSPVPVLDMSKSNPSLRERNIRATSKKIGFIGLGNMGQRIVKNLLESGHDVSIWNRTREKCTRFVEAGAHQFLTPCDVVLHCDIIFCCVSGPEATKSVLFGNRGILQGFQNCKPGTKGFVVLSALDLETAQEIASAVTSKGGNYLEAPISGSISNAEEGSLLITVSGNRELLNDCLSCFFAISRNAYYFSHDVGSASIMHMCTSMVKGVATVALAEGIALAESMNFSRNSFQECVELSAMTCPLFREKGLAMVTNNFTTNHSLKYQQSDLRMILKTSNTYVQPMPMASAANEVYKKAERLQYSNHDMSAVYFAAKR